MTPSISLTTDERKTLLDYYRCPTREPELRLRAHIILLLAQGYPWATIAAVLFCSTRTIDRWYQRFTHSRVQGLLDRRRGDHSRLGQTWPDLVVFWVTQLSPRTFSASCAAAGPVVCWP